MVMRRVMGLVGMLGAAACTTTEELPPEGFPYPTETSFCEALAVAVCNGEVIKKCASTDAECKNAFLASDACNPGGLPYHPEGGQACLDAQRGIYADASLTKSELETAAEACLGALSKSAGAGQSCGVDTDCDGTKGLRCIVKLGEMFGKCGVPLEIASGSDCTADNAVCKDGLYCAPFGTSGKLVCGDRPGVGQDCTPKDPCVETALCGADGKCAAKIPDGDPCKEDAECAGGFCIKAKGAMVTEGTCLDRLDLTVTTAGACESFRSGG
jgi:hypothetical protein